MRKAKNSMVIGAALLSACGQPYVAPPDHVDFVGSSGTEVSYDSGFTWNNPQAYDTAFIETRDCMLAAGYKNDRLGENPRSIPPPVVRVVDFMPNGYWGWTDFTNGQITMNIGCTQYRHEMVHYILWRLHYDQKANSAHADPAFKTCV